MSMVSGTLTKTKPCDIIQQPTRCRENTQYLPHFGRIGGKDHIIVGIDGSTRSVGGFHGRIGLVPVRLQGRLDDSESTQGFAGAFEGSIRLEALDHILLGRQDVTRGVRGYGRGRTRVHVQNTLDPFLFHQGFTMPPGGPGAFRGRGQKGSVAGVGSDMVYDEGLDVTITRQGGRHSQGWDQ